MKGTLYLVATPIGNLGDMTYRGVEVLKSVDAVACEDTRHSLILLNRYGVKKPLISYHKFNSSRTLPELLRRLEGGENLALITDAGLPCVSDPGVELVNAARENGIPYTVVPGATAFADAAVLSGMCASGLCFCGFLPEKASERRKTLERFRDVEVPVIFYSAPHKAEEDIRDLYAAFGEREVAVCRELTKLNESVMFTRLSDGLPQPPRGEYVLVVAGAKPQNDLLQLSPAEHLAYYLGLGMDRGDAVKRTARERGVPKNEIYQLAGGLAERFTKNDTK